MFALKRAGRKGFLVLTILLLYPLVNQVQANPRYASVVIDADTKEVLHEAHADSSRYPASLTKMMTLYMLFEAMEQGTMTLDSQMNVSVHAASMPQTNIGLRTGDIISVRVAIPALIVRSANDVAVVVAEALGGTETDFSHMMTDKARQLGMHSTTFRNASGFYDSEQKTTARDMVILSARLMKDFPQYYHHFSTQSFSYRGITYNTHNRMMRNKQDVDGLKTGYIRASGFNIATSAKRDDRRVIAVVMGGRTAASRDRHMAQLLDRSFSKVATTQFANNTDNADPILAVIQRNNILTPAPKPVTVLLDKTTAPIIMQPATRKLVITEKPENAAVVDSNNWAVQIGSYLLRDRAQARAQAAARWVPGEIVVTEVKISNRRLYRARLVGLQEKQARLACESLVQQGMECLVVQFQG